MSTNLHCKELELWQTPTHITDMCINKYRSGKNKKNMPGDYTLERYGVPFEVTDDNWIAVRERYILYVGYISQNWFNNANRPDHDGRIPTPEEVSERQHTILDTMREHVAELRSYKKLHFSAG